MKPIFKTIAKDIIVLSAQAVAFRLAAPQDQQQDVIFAAVPTKGPPDQVEILMVTFCANLTPAEA